MDDLLEVRDLKTWFPLRRGVLNRPVGYVRAVDGVSLAVGRGETVGLVGESGCGKTTLGRTICGLSPPTGGEVLFEGEPLLPRLGQSKWRRRVQIVFQDPFSSLNPRMSVMDILTEGMAHHKLLQGPRDQEAKRLLSEVGLDPASAHRYPHEFSGGQRQRLSVARALSLRPDLVVCDEAVSALDVSVQAQVIRLLIDLRKRYELSYVFISHDLAVVRHIAHRCAVMYLGVIMEHGPTEDVLHDPRHPYTQALISAVPQPGRKKKGRIVLSGDPPSPAAPPPGCRFHTRCPHVMDVCRDTVPEARKVGNASVCCHLY
ncbi:MAG: ABC transporter ATP-binding protein [Desulfatibacillaceae bacterium]